MNTLSVKAYAKINLGLCVTGLLENGYHTLDMVMQSISLWDTLTLSKGERDVTLACSDPAVPCGEENLCVKAVRLLEKKAGIPLPVSIHLEKRIPSQAGLAGGSADGAAVLAGVNRLYALGFSLGELLPLSASLGADVPFCLIGGTKRVQGFGERLSPLPSPPDCYFVLAKPESGVSTKESFARYDALQRESFSPEGKPTLSLLLHALENGDLPSMAHNLVNALEPCACNPDVPLLLTRMEALGALGCRMTGSGSAVFGIFADEMGAHACRQALEGEYPFCTVCRPVSQGLEF